ncbi:MAG: hypothetical protein JF619_02110 [Massilia sp.]|nr:hypothetical protein [Massilia sp.]
MKILALFALAILCYALPASSRGIAIVLLACGFCFEAAGWSRLVRARREKKLEREIARHHARRKP